MPLAAIVGGSYVCLHGGIGPKVHDLDSINEIIRFKDIPDEGNMTDLLWSDPCVEDYNAAEMLFLENGKRGCSF